MRPQVCGSTMIRTFNNHLHFHKILAIIMDPWIWNVRNNAKWAIIETTSNNLLHFRQVITVLWQPLFHFVDIPRNQRIFLIHITDMNLYKLHSNPYTVFQPWFVQVWTWYTSMFQVSRSYTKLVINGNINCNQLAIPILPICV